MHLAERRLVRGKVAYHFLIAGGMGGSQLTTDTAANNSAMTDFFILFIGYVADYSKFRIFCPFQRVHRTKSGVIHFVPPGQQYPYAVRRISLDPCAFDKLPSAVLDFLEGGVVSAILHGTLRPYLPLLPVPA